MRRRDPKILRYDPWGDGKGDDHYRVLRNQMIVACFKHKCAICFGPIAVGERHRAQTELNEDGKRQLKTFRFCAECCTAMCKSWRDEGVAICERYEIGQSAARRRRAT
jgi:hypothetical protein